MFVGHHHFTVEPSRLQPQRSERFGLLRQFVRPVMAIAGEQLHLIMIDARHDPVTVELDLVAPLTFGRAVDQRGQFRFELGGNFRLVRAGQRARGFLAWFGSRLVQRFDLLGGKLGFIDQCTFTEHAVGFGEQNIVVILRAGGGVLMFDQEPVFLFARHVRAHQVPDAAELLALQFEFQLALGIGFLRIFQWNPHAAIPDNHITGAVMPFRNAALEGRVIERMVFDMHGQSLDFGVEGRPFRHRPALQRAIEFEAKVIMQVRGVVLLNAELQGGIGGFFLAGAFDCSRFGGGGKIAHAVVVFEVSAHCAPALLQPIRVTVNATTAIRSTR